MFEPELKEKLQAIFDLKRVEFGVMSDIREQEILFVEISKARCRVKNGIQTAKVEGVLRVNASNEKLPFGFLSKRIWQADSELKENFFFYEIEEQSQIFRDIVQRTVSFVYFFVGQYDPEVGSITSVNFQTEVQE